MNYHWDWSFFLSQTDDGVMYINWVFSGLKWTLMVSFGAIVIAFVLGSLLGIMRTWPNRVLNGLGNLYVEFFRNIPLIVQLFLWFYVLPELLPSRWGLWMKQDLPAVVVGVIGLGLFTAARIAEQVRAGVQALPSGQQQAGLAMGLSMWQTYRYVLMPMAYRIILPTLTSEAMSTFKNSSVTFAVGVLELYFQYKQIIEKTSQVFEITLVITVLYCVLALSINGLMTLLERRLAIPGLSVTSSPNKACC